MDASSEENVSTLVSKGAYLIRKKLSETSELKLPVPFIRHTKAALDKI
jgi:hypothetical protein